MTYNPKKHYRRSIRLKNCDYSRPGGYFVTICTQNRECFLGEIINDKMEHNNFGEIVIEQWNKIPSFFYNTKLDDYQITPNHLHGIIFIVGAKHFLEDNSKIFINTQKNASPLPPHGTTPGSLSATIQNFFSITTRKINKIRNTPGVKLWQRNFYEHIIRNEKELYKIRNHINNNPNVWDTDKENPFNFC